MFRRPSSMASLASTAASPDEFYALCDRVMPHARRADVFAREQRQGWHAFGNEVTKFKPEVAA